MAVVPIWAVASYHPDSPHQAKVRPITHQQNKQSRPRWHQKDLKEPNELCYDVWISKVITTR